MNVVAIIQARMGSTRLPGKMLLPLAGAPLIQRVIERVQRAMRVDDIVLAVPSRDAAEFAVIANGRAWLYAYPGDDADLVGRYLGAAVDHDADLIVRIPGDNPCVQPEMIDAAVTSYLARPQVYVSTLYWHLHDRMYADGLGAEVFSLSRLRWLDQATQGQPSYREHPHLLFQDQHLIDGWEQYQRYANVRETVRLDVNDLQDYQFISTIYDALYPINHDFGITDIVRFLDETKTVRTSGGAIPTVSSPA